MAYTKTAKEQLHILRQSCLNRAVDLYVADQIEAAKLETVAEYFVKCIYTKLGLPVGTALSESQVQGIIVLQSSLTRAVELCLGGKINVEEIVDNAYLFAKYVYSGIKGK